MRNVGKSGKMCFVSKSGASVAVFTKRRTSLTHRAQSIGVVVVVEVVGVLVVAVSVVGKRLCTCLRS